MDLYYLIVIVLMGISGLYHIISGRDILGTLWLILMGFAVIMYQLVEIKNKLK